MHNFVFKIIKIVVYLNTYLKSNVVVNLYSYILTYDQGTVDTGIVKDVTSRIRFGCMK